MRRTSTVFRVLRKQGHDASVAKTIKKKKEFNDRHREGCEEGHFVQNYLRPSSSQRGVTRAQTQYKTLKACPPTDSRRVPPDLGISHGQGVVGAGESAAFQRDVN